MSNSVVADVNAASSPFSTVSSYTAYAFMTWLAAINMVYWIIVMWDGHIRLIDLPWPFLIGFVSYFFYMDHDRNFLIHAQPQIALQGTALFVPLKGDHVYMIEMAMYCIHLTIILSLAIPSMAFLFRMYREPYEAIR